MKTNLILGILISISLVLFVVGITYKWDLIIHICAGTFGALAGIGIGTNLAAIVDYNRKRRRF